MHVFKRTVTIDGESNRAVHGARSAGSGINRPLLPVAINSVLHRFDVPTIASGEIGATLALNGDAARTATGCLRVARREIRIAAFAVGDVILVNWRLILESSGFGRRGERLFLLEFWDFGGVGFRLGSFRRLFLVKTFCWIDGFA